MTHTQDIKARLDIVSYIERFVPSLKKSGKTYKACCPFHNEKTPSFVVNPQTQTWRCYGACAEGGDIFSFYQTYHNAEFKDAFKALADEAGIELPKYNKKQLSDNQKRKLDILDDLASRYTNLLIDYDGAEPVRAYLADRGISSDSIQQWRLGYAPRQNIVKQLLAKYQLKDLEDLGIIYTSDHGQLRCSFWNRLIIPIQNAAGQVVGFGARKLDDGKSPKYKNSTESDLFHKSHLLYGWHTARKQAQWDSQIVIVEGYMDVIQAHQAGYTNVVAQMGTALTDEQIKLIADTNIKTIVLCLDGDNAGKQAADRALDNLIEHLDKKDIRIAELAAGQDPDDIIKAGNWEDVISNASPVIDYLISRAVAKLPDNPSLGQRHAIANEVIPKLYKLEESSKLWSVQQLALEIGLNPLALVDMANKLMTVKLVNKAEETLDIPTPDNTTESYVIRCLLEHDNAYYYQMIAEFSKLGLEPLSHNDFAPYSSLFQQIVDIIETNDNTVPLDHIDIDPAHVCYDEPNLPDFLLNCMYLRLDATQRTMDELLELRNFDLFTEALTYREQLRHTISQIG